LRLRNDRLQPRLEFSQPFNSSLSIHQAINGAHRIGYKSQVIVTKFICKDTVEGRNDKVLAEKRALFAAILGGGEQSNASLSMNASEIFGLFDLRAPVKHGGLKAIGPKAA
jgi:hypothetical protein